ncbi:hypothetical protein [Streptomyces albireticuli]|uniref:Uncharacterized protein n=1 Tax=Streptomyces albireticuli TaxID=1940 RepID=A0A2A2D8X6_9ACTN|nr:hypothetical protein [Streptomyces albireticuli]MCD9145904.1 hypothetical protein [Streptomyces albireticuli]MCD9166074.1 hypothetical protein [Streptomyces albireticuli]MCD9196354.1 hypothetical protein [Streptomyces albireticuli]PAU47974.1 hypothetical protein CK936_15810 [Streptomyces albireticuli]
MSTTITARLSGDDLLLLATAHRHAPGRIPGHIVRELREQHGLRETQYVQRVLGLLRSPEGREAAPALARQWNDYLDRMAAARGEVRR